MSKTLTPEQTETFLSLWERVIERCGEMWRGDMEQARASLWGDLPAAEQTRDRAASLLKQLSRDLDKNDDDDRELVRQVTNFRQALVRP